MEGEPEKSVENEANEANETKEKKKPNIKHIVLSGGGTIGFGQYGALRQSNKKGLWSIDNIESIYGISVGCIFGLFISLNLLN